MLFALWEHLIEANASFKRGRKVGTDETLEAMRIIDCDSLEDEVLRGHKILKLLGETAHADAIWDIVLPIVSAIGSVDPLDAGYHEGKNIETAIEILREVVRIRGSHGKIHLADDNEV